MSANNRLSKILSQVEANAAPAAFLSQQQVLSKSDDDVVVVAACRTPIGRAKRGNLKDTFVEELLATTLKGVLDRSKIEPAQVGDIVVGCVLGSNVQMANLARMGAFFAGFPESVPVHILNRQCSSGLQAIASVAASIKAGYYDIGIGAGMESMSQAVMGKWDGDMNPHIFEHDKAKDCLIPMGITSENVAAEYKVSRKDQDEFSVQSHARAAAAIKAGKFKDEIVPVHTKVADKNGDEKEVVVDTDEGVRAGTTWESLSKLKPAFSENGTTTAGNSSQVSDGASAVLLMRRSKAKQLGMPVLGVFRSFAVAGVPPRVMGIGPVFAIPKAVEQAGLKLSDIDLFEINEAFASQALYSVRELGLSTDKVNVNGGAIALGHPLGCTGARLTASLLYEMRRRKSRFGVVSMCIGSGMGAAAVYEVEQ